MIAPVIRVLMEGHAKLLTLDLCATVRQNMLVIYAGPEAPTAPAIRVLMEGRAKIPTLDLCATVQ